MKFFFTAIVCGYTAIAAAMGSKEPPASARATALQQSYSWHDGSSTKTVWLNPKLVAEFDGRAEQSEVRKAAPNAREVPHGPANAVRIWEVDNADQAIAKVREAGRSAKVSPVFHDSASGAGRMRAAPGNVIVYLNPEWDQRMIEQWATRNKVKIVKKLNFGTNIYVIKTGPGLEAVQKANALREAGEVVKAFPDWWQETATR